MPKRFHPVPVCSDYRCQAFIQRLRSGIRQSVADAFIRDRVARINGFFRRTVEPVERVRAEKDREISALRLRLKRLEQAACMTSAEAEAVQLDERIVEMRLRAEDLRSEGARLGHEVAELKVGGLKFGFVAFCLIICFSGGAGPHQGGARFAACGRGGDAQDAGGAEGRQGAGGAGP